MTYVGQPAAVLVRLGEEERRRLPQPDIPDQVGERVTTVLQPLPPALVARSAEAVTSPAGRLALVRAAIHAARPGAIRALQSDDVDPGSRRILLNGCSHPWTTCPGRLCRPGWIAGAGRTPPTRT
ncbi:hypothetical protein OG948_57965 (plasmid) [Embleya sp. NBC_00888]|uniref:hypothetical protein n=1 Tax=Embleya sp. NBC_00888 TaxID=2975960 RepID=UPI002F914787|nr:hypothetical protein OG948_57965 [Embleya sp. NBC_00888]